ncbi:MAG: helix-turn-helix domain-containing protein [Halobacteriaceae archaeon]
MREATIHIPHAELAAVGIEEFVAVCGEAGLRDISELSCESDGCLFTLTLAEPLPDGAFADLDYVEWHEALDTGGDAATYLCKVTVPGFDAAAPDGAAASSTELGVDGDGIDVSLVGNQSAIADSVADYDDAGMAVLLRTLGDYTGPGDALDGLTGRQREVLETAHDRGYFEVPREASVEDVADACDLDPSTVAEHLQRAERNLVRDVLGR